MNIQNLHKSTVTKPFFFQTIFAFLTKNENLQFYKTLSTLNTLKNKNQAKTFIKNDNELMDAKQICMFN